MPYCPSCRNEYEEGVLRCGDCEADLVAVRPPDPREVEEREGARPVPLRFQDDSVRDHMLRALEAAHVPAALREGSDPPGALWIPAAYAEAARRVVAHAFTGLRLEWSEEGGRVVPAEAAAGEQVDEDPVLRLGPAEVLRRGEEAWRALDRCLRSGTASILARAGLLLRRTGDEGFARLACAAREAIDRGDGERAAALVRELSDGADRRRAPWPPEVLALASLLDEPAPARRAWGADVAGRLRLRHAYAKLVALLEDSDPKVAYHADEALIEITDEDLGFDPGLEPAERERILEARRRWGSERGL